MEPYAEELQDILTGRETLMPVTVKTIAERHFDRFTQDGLIPTDADRLAVCRLLFGLLLHESIRLARIVDD